ncbi:MAG: tetratricopeptide repeat protein [Chloroflexota bacterium]
MKPTARSELFNEFRAGYSGKGRLPEAVAWYEEALKLARQSEDSGLKINILQNLGAAYEQQGDFAQAKIQYAEGLTLAENQKTRITQPYARKSRSDCLSSRQLC